MTRGATIDRRELYLLGDVRRDVQITSRLDEAGNVVVFVAAERATAVLSWAQHDHRGFPFGGAGGSRRTHVHDQAIAALLQQVPR